MDKTDIDLEKAITITYTNYRNETNVRKIIPIEIRYTSTEWHPNLQWILYAYDLDKQAERGFAIKDIHNWE